MCLAYQGGTKTGGAYKDVPANGGQVHHMPADSVSPTVKMLVQVLEWILQTT